MNVEIKKMNLLDDSTVKEIKKFESICKEHDKLAGSMDLDTSMNFDKRMKNVFLLYEDGKLASALSIFAPRTSEGEVYGYTLPECRRRGYFKRLLEEAAEELRTYGVSDFLFICEKKSDAGNAMLEKMDPEWDHGEHLMAYRGEKPLPTEGSLVLRRAGRDDIQKLVDMNMRVFSDYYKDPDELTLKMSNIFDSKDREMYMAYHGDEPVGLCSVGMEKEEPSIYGFGILPGQRRKGYGKEFLKLVMNSLIARDMKTIKLDVDYENSNALDLYLKTGFEIEASFGYFRKRL